MLFLINTDIPAITVAVLVSLSGFEPDFPPFQDGTFTRLVWVTKLKKVFTCLGQFSIENHQDILYCHIEGNFILNLSSVVNPIVRIKLLTLVHPENFEISTPGLKDQYSSLWVTSAFSISYFVKKEIVRKTALVAGEGLEPSRLAHWVMSPAWYQLQSPRNTFSARSNPFSYW